jgi:hypothetical protein
MWQTILYAALIAGVTAILGFLKTSSPESFSWRKFLQTLILTMLFSAGSSLTGLSPGDLENSIIGLFLAQLVENFLKSIFKDDSKLKELVISSIRKRWS